MLLYFENLLPDSGEIRRRIGQHVGAQSDKAFDLLEKIGRDCVGALQLTGEREPAPDVRTINASPINDGEIEQLLLKTSGSRTFGTPELDDDFRLSIAGAQEKTALLIHDNNHTVAKKHTDLLRTAAPAQFSPSGRTRANARVLSFCVAITANPAPAGCRDAPAPCRKEFRRSDDTLR